MMAGPIRNVSPGATAAIAMAKPTAPAPRPPNAWILYRSDKLKQLPPLKPGERRAQAEVSRTISTLWKHETGSTRQYYERLADEKKAEHSIKYPGYRFQPMKKEEKVALREQRKLEKEAERKARQQRGRQPQPPVPQPPPAPSTPPVPHVPTLQHLPIYPPMNTGSIYYPMDLFGAAGPSPPLSIASSPTPESTPESASTSDEHWQIRHSRPPSNTTTPSLLYTTTALPSESREVQANAVAPSPLAATSSSGGNPYLAYLGPANNHLMYQQSQLIMPSAMPAFANPTLPAAMPRIASSSDSMTSAQATDAQHFNAALGDTNQQATVTQDGQSTGGIDHANPSILTGTSDSANIAASTMDPPLNYVSDYDFQSAQYEQFGDNQITFDFPPQFFESMSTLIPPNSDCHNTVAAAHMGHNIFALPNFDVNVLNAHPMGELEVDLNRWDFDFGAYINDGMLDSTGSLNSSLEQQDTVETEVQPTSQDLFNFLQLAASGDDSPSTSSHPSMPATPAVSQAALSIDLSNTESSQKTAAPYAPPSGAAHASTRRVGGSWKPPLFISNEGSFDYSSPCTTGVSHS